MSKKPKFTFLRLTSFFTAFLLAATFHLIGWFGFSLKKEKNEPETFLSPITVSLDTKQKPELLRGAYPFLTAVDQPPPLKLWELIPPHQADFIPLQKPSLTLEEEFILSWLESDD